MQQPGAQAYEISHLRSNIMPLSPFTGPYQTKAKPTAGIDAIGHFAAFRQPWVGKSAFPADEALYYGGLTQKEVKPTPDSALLKLGMDEVPPLVTSAVLLDAKGYKKGAMKAGELVSAADIQAMLKAQGLGRRGILPGDVVYVHAGWGELWKDPDTEKIYYSQAPGKAGPAPGRDKVWTSCARSRSARLLPRNS